MKVPVGNNADPLVAKTGQPIANLAHLPNHGMETILGQKRRSELGRGLSHLVSKFEFLDSLSRQSKPLPTKKTDLPGGNDSTSELNRPPSSNSSVSALSLSDHATSEKAGTIFPGQGGDVKDDELTTGEARLSLVAERRKLFEVDLGDARLSTFTDRAIDPWSFDLSCRTLGNDADKDGMG